MSIVSHHFTCSVSDSDWMGIDPDEDLNASFQNPGIAERRIPSLKNLDLQLLILQSGLMMFAVELYHYKVIHTGTRDPKAAGQTFLTLEFPTNIMTSIFAELILTFQCIEPLMAKGVTKDRALAIETPGRGLRQSGQIQRAAGEHRWIIPNPKIRELLKAVMVRQKNGSG